MHLHVASYDSYSTDNRAANDNVLPVPWPLCCATSPSRDVSEQWFRVTLRERPGNEASNHSQDGGSVSSKHLRHVHLQRHSVYLHVNSGFPHSILHLHTCARLEPRCTHIYTCYVYVRIIFWVSFVEVLPGLVVSFAW